MGHQFGALATQGVAAGESHGAVEEVQQDGLVLSLVEVGGGHLGGEGVREDGDCQSGHQGREVLSLQNDQGVLPQLSENASLHEGVW